MLRQMGLLSPTLESKKKPLALVPLPRLQTRSQVPLLRPQQQSKSIINSIQNQILYQCNQCFRLLSDNRFLIPSTTTDDVNICFTNVSNISIDSFIAISNDGCLYSDVECLCGVNLGRHYIATTTHFDHLRFMFCLNQNSIYSYILQSTSATTTTRNLSLLHLQEIQNQCNSKMIQLMIADDDLDLMYASTTTTINHSTSPPPPPEPHHHQSPLSSSFSDTLEFRFQS